MMEVQRICNYGALILKQDVYIIPPPLKAQDQSSKYFIMDGSKIKEPFSL